MDNSRPTIIDFVEQYSRRFPNNVYIREKVDGVWKETTQEQTRNEAMLFFYIYSGAWQKSEGELLSKEHCRPDTLVQNAGVLPATKGLKDRIIEYFQKKIRVGGFITFPSY